MKKKVAVLVLNWNNYSDSHRCLSSVFETDYPDREIILIDNNSTDDSFKRLKSDFEKRRGILFIKNSDNFGFAGGFNVGIKYAADHEYDFIWVLSNDIVVERNSISHLVDAMAQNPDAVMAGPTIYFDGSRSIMEQYCRLNLFLGRFLIINSLDDSRVLKIENDYKNYVGGAAPLVRRESVMKAGLMPEEYFLYDEDAAWCQNFRDNDKFLYVGPAKIWHKRSASTGGPRKSVLPDYYDSRNFLYFIKTYYPFWLPYELLTSIVNKVFPKIIRGRWQHLKFVLYGFTDFFRGKMGKIER